MSVTIIVSPEAAEQLRKPLRGDGGYQRMLRRFRKGLLPRSTVLTVDDADFMRIARYAADYGQGGYQDRILRMLGIGS